MVYTPGPIVDLMLDACPGNDFRDVKICDPACGDGQFLAPLVERICAKIKRAKKSRGGCVRKGGCEKGCVRKGGCEEGRM